MPRFCRAWCFRGCLRPGEGRRAARLAAIGRRIGQSRPRARRRTTRLRLKPRPCRRRTGNRETRRRAGPVAPEPAAHPGTRPFRRPRAWPKRQSGRLVGRIAAKDAFAAEFRRLPWATADAGDIPGACNSGNSTISERPGDGQRRGGQVPVARERRTGSIVKRASFARRRE